MANPTYIKGNLINVFMSVCDTSVADPKWEYMTYTTNSGLNITSSLSEISSKDHGIHPDKILSSQNWEISEECLASVDSLDTIISAAQTGKELSFVFAKVAEPDEAGSTGLNPVTSIGSTDTWTIGSWKKYGNGVISSAQVGASNGDTATLSLTISGVGGLADVEPTGTARKSFVKA